MPFILRNLSGLFYINRHLKKYINKQISCTLLKWYHLLRLHHFLCLYMSVTITQYFLHCRRDFDKLISCVTNTMSICARNKVSPEQINNFINQNFQESTICEGGGILVPSLGSQCSSSFNKICSGFLASYREMFVSRPVDGSLCW